MEKKDWQAHGLALKEVLALEYSPVAISCRKAPASPGVKKKARICRAILDAARGEAIEIDKTNNVCMGAGWHLGFTPITDMARAEIFKKILVEKEKLFSSIEALDKMISQMPPAPDNRDAYFSLAPLEKSEFKPELVIFVVNPEAACKVLTLATYTDGAMPEIKIGGPVCRLGIIYPLVTGEVNISFYDHTARKICHVEKDKLLISVPYEKILKMVESLDTCSAGRAKITYPLELGNIV
ncbi:MAG: DUF169 domain-containing protein [Candidatus Omnitrophica bacterium]|nr:DUF169 domain-containing protein [Candidatus Omnitrophota bacterium]MDD5610727.1 DUF169 domain-containing protein [Candidatus Omnitrophota bacterium]